MRIFGSPLSRALGGAGFGQAAAGIASLQALITAFSPIAYWPLSEASGTTANDTIGGFDGAYEDAYTLAQPGIGDGSPSVFWTDGRINMTGAVAGLDGPFSGAAGTVFLAARVENASRWTNSPGMMLLEIGVDANNRIIVAKTDTLSEINVHYIAGGTDKFVVLAASTLNWFSIAMTWDKAADAMKFYFNGAQSGSTQTGLGTWAGALAAGWTEIANLFAGSPWHGWLSYVALWNTALTPAQIDLLSPSTYFTD